MPHTILRDSNGSPLQKRLCTLPYLHFFRNYHLIITMSCYECSSESYDKAEAWCRETVSAGHDMLFSTALFAAEMTRVSRELDVSVQVNFLVSDMNLTIVAFDSCALGSRQQVH